VYYLYGKKAPCLLRLVIKVPGINPKVTEIMVCTYGVKKRDDCFYNEYMEEKSI
jgi:hypothetical protein